MSESNKMVQLDRNVPMPPRPPSGGRPFKYPWADMQVGDSFAVPYRDGDTTDRAFRRVDAQWAKRRFGYQFAQRMVTENGVRAVRTWRVA